MAIHVVIMAGGRGERLWPLSREGMPKQLLSFGSDKSLLRQTFERTVNLTPIEYVYVVTGANIAEQVFMELPELPRENILIEPVGRNTAPCIAFAAAAISRKDPDGIMAVFPADHIIKDSKRFIRAMGFGIGALEQYPEFLITLGMVPDHPETGYGYIAPGDVLSSNGDLMLHRVERFHEKPDSSRARDYIEKGFLWNAGMFLWRVDAILRAFETHMPDMYTKLMSIKSSMSPGSDEIGTFYGRIEAVSIDYGVMEKAQHVAVIPAEFGWNDIGSWDAIGQILPHDTTGNVVSGTAMIVESMNNVVWSTQKNIVLIGVKDMVVVEGQDAILICPRDKSQLVSKVSRKIKT